MGIIQSIAQLLCGRVSIIFFGFLGLEKLSSSCSQYPEHNFRFSEKIPRDRRHFSPFFLQKLLALACRSTTLDPERNGCWSPFLFNRLWLAMDGRLNVRPARAETGERRRCTWPPAGDTPARMRLQLRRSGLAPPAAPRRPLGR
jgi:hypothetical protein